MEYSIYIMGAKWTIRAGDFRELIKSSSNGWCDPDNRVILIDRREDMTEELFNRILMHEIMHAYMFMSGLSEILEDDMQESLSVMAENFTNIFTFQKGVLMACGKKSGKKKPKK